MFILVGELEFNEKHFYVDGNTSFLFVSTQFGVNLDHVEYVYAISPYPSPKIAHVGDVYRTKHNMSVTEFLQKIVNSDEQIGRGVIMSFAKAKVRLKGMTEWIERKN